MSTKKSNHGCTRMDTDFQIKVDVHYKDNSARMVRTFRGAFQTTYGMSLNKAAAAMVADLETHPNAPKNPTRLVVSIYPKKKAAGKNPCESASIRGAK